MGGWGSRFAGAGMVLLQAGWMLAQGKGNAAVAGATAAKPAMATVTFQIIRPGLAVPKFRIAVREDGTGSYAGEEVVGPPAGAEPPVTSHVEREVLLSEATTERIFKAARGERFFDVACASKAKNIADTGAKSLSYAGPDGSGTCDYNYTENKTAYMLTELFLGIGATLEEGRRLEFKHRFDRLGVDAELDTLTQSSEAGRALELNTIAPVLRQLAGDTELMQRVRLRAAKLLDRAAEGK